MTPVIALVVGALGGALVALLASVLLARRARAVLLARVVASVRPVLERRAVALGIAPADGPRLNIGHDGELELTGGDGELATLLRLADTIENHEHAQLGYLDTMRVSRDEVDASLIEKSGDRLKGR